MPCLHFEEINHYLVVGHPHFSRDGPAVTSEALALAITTAVAHGRGIVFSVRLITGELTIRAGDAAHVCMMYIQTVV